MQSKDEFKITIKEISDLAFSNAVQNLTNEIKDNPDPGKWNDELKTKFKHLVHDGFKEAQLRLERNFVISKNANNK